MVSLLDKFWESKVARAIAVLSAFTAIITRAFPGSETATRVALGCLILLGIYVLAGLFLGLVKGIRTLSERMIAAIASRVVQQQLDQEKRESEKEAKQLLTEAGNAYRYIAERYGIGYHSLKIDCNIRPDGSAQVRRKAEIEAHSELSQLDTFLLIPESPPPGETWSIAPLQVRPLSPGYNVSLISTAKQGSRFSALIAISPQLGEGQSVTYEMIERLPVGLYAIDLTEEEQAKRKTLHDYFGWFINRPTKNLSLAVYFPEDVQPEVFGLEVRYASAAPGIPSELLHHKEQGRLLRPTLSGPEGGRYVLKLDVDYPMIGLVYILRWQPLKTTPKQTPQ